MSKRQAYKIKLPGALSYGKHYFLTAGKHSISASLLRVCSQVYQEAKAYFFQHTFHFSSAQTFYEFLKATNHHSMKNISSISFGTHESGRERMLYIEEATDQLIKRARNKLMGLQRLEVVGTEDGRDFKTFDSMVAVGQSPAWFQTLSKTDADRLIDYAKTGERRLWHC